MMRISNATVAISLIMFFFANACAANRQSISEEELAGKSIPTQSPSTVYFMNFTFDEWRAGGKDPRLFRSGEFVRDWYTRHLTALNEPSFVSVRHPNTKYFRFLWLRSFHNPVAIRVEMHTPQVAGLTFTMSDGAGGYNPGKVTKSLSRVMDPNDLASFKALLADAKICVSAPEDSLGLDGAQWVFEQRHGNNYCAVERWSPKSGAFSDLGRFLLDLWEFEETDEQPIY